MKILSIVLLIFISACGKSTVVNSTTTSDATATSTDIYTTSTYSNGPNGSGNCDGESICEEYIKERFITRGQKINNDVPVQMWNSNYMSSGQKSLLATDSSLYINIIPVNSGNTWGQTDFAGETNCEVRMVSGTNYATYAKLKVKFSSGTTKTLNYYFSQAYTIDQIESGISLPSVQQIDMGSNDLGDGSFKITLESVYYYDTNASQGVPLKSNACLDFVLHIETDYTNAIPYR